MCAFFVTYFWLLNYPVYPVTIMPLIGIDRFIEFHPAAVVLYASLWVYVSLAFALLKNGRELVSHGAAWVVLSMLGLGIFFLWPTAVPMRLIDWPVHSAFSFLRSIDASGNACPSLHVAFAVLSAIWIERLLCEMDAGWRSRVVNWIWCMAIVYSTLATYQHVTLDAVAGAALGVLVAGLHWCFRATRDC